MAGRGGRFSRALSCVIIAAAFIMLVPGALATTYRCTEPNGTVDYTNTACAKGAQAEVVPDDVNLVAGSSHSSFLSTWVEKVKSIGLFAPYFWRPLALTFASIFLSYFAYRVLTRRKKRK